jgi:formate hydrogenlyase subunit 3/multisubunit Na+/H+ antiporter MnhD subunit
MVDFSPAHVVASEAGILLVAAIFTPVAALLLAVLAGPSYVRIIAGAALGLGLAIAAAIVATFLKTGEPIVYHLGGWPPPLGIALRADGLSVAMLGVTAFVLASVTLYAWEEFDPKTTDAERPASTFWLLNLGVAAGLYTAFLANDLFTLYVALELLTFSAAPLVCVHSNVDSLRAALRYLLFAIVGSMFYLAGVVLLYC